MILIVKILIGVVIGVCLLAMSLVGLILLGAAFLATIDLYHLFKDTEI